MNINRTTIKTGYIAAYWDISQAEPRSICYRSGDPLFKELYEQGGGDAYRELASRRWLASHGYDSSFDSPGRAVIDKAWVKEQRTLYKSLILSGIYGQSIKTLSKRAGVSYEVGNEIWTGFMNPMKKVAEFRDSNIEYAQKTGYIKTILGEKIPCQMDRVVTTANNCAVQGFTAVVLSAFFYNCLDRAMNLGIDTTTKMTIHDSSTVEFPIKHLIHMDLVCRKYFRQACRKYFLADYKFDWDLLLDLMKHIPYNFDIRTGQITLTLWREKVDYFLDHLASNYKFKLIERTDFDEPNDSSAGIKLLLSKYKHSYHTIMDNEKFRQFKQSTIKLQLTEPLKDIDWWFEPLEPTFTEHAKTIKWLAAPED